MSDCRIGGAPPSSHIEIGIALNMASRDFVTVDMRGLKAALVHHAAERQLSVSNVVRVAVEKELKPHAGEPPAAELGCEGTVAPRIRKLSIRLSEANARQLAAAARSARLSNGAYVAGLVAGVPVLCEGDDRPAHLQSLAASCAELAELSRSLNHLVALLSRGSVRAAQEYRDTLGALERDVRAHLRLAAHVVGRLQPSRLPRTSGDSYA